MISNRPIVADSILTTSCCVVKDHSYGVPMDINFGMHSKKSVYNIT